MDLREIRHACRVVGYALNTINTGQRNGDTPTPWQTRSPRTLALHAVQELTEYLRNNQGASLYRAGAYVLLACELHARQRLAARWHGHNCLEHEENPNHEENDDGT